MPPPAPGRAAPAGPPSVPLHAPRFVVDPRASELRLLVFRAGPLAKFGHDHVLVGRVRGDIYAGDTAAVSGFRLDIPVTSFAVDPPTARAEEGPAFAETVSAQARSETRENMLGPKVLDATRYPLIRVVSVALSGPRWNPEVTARVTLHGVTHDLRFPAAVVEDGPRLTVIARFRIAQSDFGIEPFSILGGGLRVRDAVDVRLKIVARRDRRSAANRSPIARTVLLSSFAAMGTSNSRTFGTSRVTRT